MQAERLAAAEEELRQLRHDLAVERGEQPGEDPEENDGSEDGDGDDYEEPDDQPPSSPPPGPSANPPAPLRSLPALLQSVPVAAQAELAAARSRIQELETALRSAQESGPCLHNESYIKQLETDAAKAQSRIQLQETELQLQLTQLKGLQQELAEAKAAYKDVSLCLSKVVQQVAHAALTTFIALLQADHKHEHMLKWLKAVKDWLTANSIRLPPTMVSGNTVKLVSILLGP